MNWRQRRAGFRCVFAFAAAAMLIGPARAQQGNIQSIRFYTVKPDRVGDFLAATKEFAEVAKKGGSERYFFLLHSLTGANEYVRVENFTKWAEIDETGPEPKMKEQAAQLQSITTRIFQCIESSHRIIDEVQSDLSLPQTGGVQMLRVLRTRVRPEKANEYMALVKSETLPAAKKAGLKFYTVSQVRYGEPSTEFVSASGLSKWADLDGGLWIQKSMGEEGYQRFLAKLRPLIIESEAEIYSVVFDSSYQPARQPAAK
jgi:quinol monooxygenase YgiN